MQNTTYKSFYFFKLIFFTFLFSFTTQIRAQFPFIQSFKNSTAPGIEFGGSPKAFLTGGAGLRDGYNDIDGEGYLRLTNKSQQQRGIVWSDLYAFPSKYGMTISFEYYTYGGTGADGIAFILFDATASPVTAGAFGSSLGYAQQTGVDGFSKGYLGIGIDEYGGFASNDGGKTGGSSSGISSNITLRGQGSGTTGYSYLTGAQTTISPNSFNVAGRDRTATDNTKSGFRKIEIVLNPRSQGGFFIDVNLTHGNIKSSIITNYAYTTIAPQKLKFAISSSTGAETNFHEIRNLDISVDLPTLFEPIATPLSFSGCAGLPATSLNDINTNNNGSVNTLGSINRESIDFDLETPGIQASKTIEGKGTFSYDSVTGKITFKPTSNTVEGTITIDYTFKDNYGKPSNISNITYTAIVNRPADIVIPATICLGDSYLWSLNGQSYSNTGTYKIINDGCTANEVLNLTVNSKPTPPIITTTSANCLAAGTSSISNYVSGNTYTFNPSGPTVNTTGLINGMTIGTSYTVTSADANCTSLPSASFSNKAMNITECFPSLKTEVKSLNSSVCNVLNETVSYEVKITNSGNGTANRVRFYSMLFEGVVFDSATVTYSANASGPAGPLSNILPIQTLLGDFTIPPNETVTILINVKIKSLMSLGTYGIDGMSIHLDPTRIIGPIREVTAFTNSFATEVIPNTYEAGGNVLGTNFSKTTSSTSDVTFVSAPAIPTISATTASCSAAGTSKINNYVSGNTYTFTPTGPTVSSTGLINAMTSGTSYTVTASDTNCTSLASASFSNAQQLAAPAVPVIAGTAASCSAAATSTISNYVSANTYTFTPTGPTVDATGLINGMAIGTSYTVTASDANCTSLASASFSNAQQLAAPAVPVIAGTAASCSAAATSTISNYVSANTYTFTPTGPTVDATGLINGMASGTSYTVTASDSNCTSLASASFSNAQQLAAPAVPVIAGTTASCSAAGTSKINNYVSGNTYTFTPTGPTVSSTGLINAMTSGTSYTVTASDANCTSVASASFSNAQQLAKPAVPAIVHKAASCSAAATSTISNYVSGNTYTFTPTGPTVDATGLISGMTSGTSYTVTSSDANCTSLASASFSNAQQLAAPAVPVIAGTAASCSAAGTSKINNYVSGNTYTFTPTGPTVDATGLISGMTIGTSYTVTSSDANCTSVASASFSNAQQLAKPAVPAIVHTAASCSAAGTSSISNYVSANTYTFTPAGPTVDATGLISAMTSGTSYTVTASDANCTSLVSASFSNAQQLAAPAVPVIAGTAASCSAAGTSTISNYVSGNTYTFTPAGPTVSSTGLISAMTIGTSYTVTSSDANCTSVASASFSNAQQLALPAQPILSKVTQPSCTKATGSLTITNYNASYSYAVTPSIGVIQNGNKIILPIGNYKVTATLGSCESIVSETVVVNTPVPLIATLLSNSLLPEFCAGDKDGAFSIEISGGNMPYSYSLDKQSGAFSTGTSAQTIFDFANLSAGKHTVYIKDALGCTAQIEVILHDAVVINPVANINYSCVKNAPANTVTINIDPKITNPADVDYSLDGAAFQSRNVFTNLASGTHTVTARHTNGCEQSTKSFVIDQIMPLTLTLADGELNEIVATATGGADGQYKYSFNDESYATANKFIIYKSGMYTVTVTDKNGCTATASRHFEYIDVCIPNYFTPNGDGNNDEWGPGCTGNYKHLTFTIFDRYGRIIGNYKYDQKWDGKYNGAELSSGDYWYVLKLNDNKDNREFVGHFTLYR